jgi:Asp-tRNA(Asn)/Glu-tRNA(Gln) amidotransferase C subunit
MDKEKRYSLGDFDIDALTALSKLSLGEKEKNSFLCDVCEMANYTYEALKSESADGTLAVCAYEGENEKRLCELREDISALSDADILSGAPDARQNCFFVPNTVKGENE